MEYYITIFLIFSEKNPQISKKTIILRKMKK